MNGVKDRTCGDCKHYVQHFGLFDGKLQKVFCGHCMQNYAKRKNPDTPVCSKFVAGVSLKKKMVSKEYLTKKLLQKVLQMELWTQE